MANEDESWKKDKYRLQPSERLTKKLLMSLDEDYLLSTGGFCEPVAPLDKRADQWNRIKVAGSNGKACIIAKKDKDASNQISTRPPSQQASPPVNPKVLNELRNKCEMFMLKENAAIGTFGKANFQLYGRGIVSVEVQKSGEITYGYQRASSNDKAMRMMLDYNPESAVVLIFTDGQNVLPYCVDIFMFGSEQYTPELPDYF
jgi:hypothetical protein